MSIATFEQYCAMLDNAKRGRFAYPAIKIAGLEGLNATLEGFAEARGERALFNSHMFDGSELSLGENLAISKRYLDRLAAIDVILEIETGVVGGEEDGHTTPRESTAGMKERVVQACADLRSTGTILSVR